MPCGGKKEKKNPQTRGFESILGIGLEGREESSALASASRGILGRSQFEAKSRPGEEKQPSANQYCVRGQGQGWTFRGQVQGQGRPVQPRPRPAYPMQGQGQDQPSEAEARHIWARPVRGRGKARLIAKISTKAH